jgi:hypothetical protein
MLCIVILAWTLAWTFILFSGMLFTAYGVVPSDPFSSEHSLTDVFATHL